MRNREQLTLQLDQVQQLKDKLQTAQERYDT